MMTEEKVVFSVKELQVLLGIGRDAAYALMRNRAFPSMRLGGRYVVGRDAFDQWLKRNEGKEIRL